MRTLSLIFFFLCCGWINAAEEPAVLRLNHDDVVAFVGGADVAARVRTGHLESLLAGRYPTVRFRNFGWEGDTVFAQPRDVGFPPFQEHLLKASVSVIVVQFGRTEAMSGTNTLSPFLLAYKSLLRDFTRITPRLVLVTPVPFENGGGLLPNLALKNGDLEQFADAIRALGMELHLPVIDLFKELSNSPARLTDDGLQLTPYGQAKVAKAFARQAELSDVAKAAGEAGRDGTWANLKFEALRQAIIAKNRLWFNYWRPQNWAFLGGDRTEQPSSRDHLNPKIRWFPAEMEKYPALIEKKEKEIAQMAVEVMK
jgi:hypothetical protein